MVAISRHDWYQTEQNVVVSIMMKNCKKDDVDVEFGKQTVIMLSLILFFLQY